MENLKLIVGLQKSWLDLKELQTRTSKSGGGSSEVGATYPAPPFRGNEFG